MLIGCGCAEYFIISKFIRSMASRFDRFGTIKWYVIAVMWIWRHINRVAAHRRFFIVSIKYTLSSRTFVGATHRVNGGLFVQFFDDLIGYSHCSRSEEFSRSRQTNATGRTIQRRSCDIDRETKRLLEIGIWSHLNGSAYFQVSGSVIGRRPDWRSVLTHLQLNSPEARCPHCYAYLSLSPCESSMVFVQPWSGCHSHCHQPAIIKIG